MPVSGPYGLIIPDLKGWRRWSLLTQQELAERSGLTHAVIVKAEKQRPVRYTTVRKLAEALNMTPEKLLTESAPRARGLGSRVTIIH